MTKKHFIWAARRTKAEGPCNSLTPRVCRRCIIEEAYVSLFREFGPRFNERRFREACKP